MVHDILDFVKALAWPCVTIYIVVRFGAGITALLDELPLLVRRMRSAHGLGIEIELDKLDEELPVAEKQALTLHLQAEKEPSKRGTEHDG